MLVPSIEDLRGNWLVTRRANNEMYMCCTHWMPVEEPKELSGRTIGGNGVWSWAKAVETVATVFTSCEAPSEVEIDLILVLLVVKPVGRIVPDIQLRTLDRLSSQVVRNGPMPLGMITARNAVYYALTHLPSRGVGPL